MHSTTEFRSSKCPGSDQIDARFQNAFQQTLQRSEVQKRKALIGFRLDKHVNVARGVRFASRYGSKNGHMRHTAHLEIGAVLAYTLQNTRQLGNRAGRNIACSILHAYSMGLRNRRGKQSHAPRAHVIAERFKKRVQPDDVATRLLRGDGCACVIRSFGDAPNTREPKCQCDVIPRRLLPKNIQ